MTKTARSLIISSLLVTVIVFGLAYAVLRSTGSSSSTSDEDSRQWGSLPGFPMNWSTAELPTYRPAASTIDSGTGHFEVDEETPSPQPPPMARPITDVVCRTGPSTLYPPYSYLTPDQSMPIDGRNAEVTWWRLVVADDTSCWVWAELLVIADNLDGVPQLQPPPLPTATERPISTPGAVAGCWVIDPQHPNGFCRPGNCTPNDFPGTTCTIP